MAEYIEREAAKRYPIRLNHYDKKNGNIDFVLGIESVMEYIDELPAADVVEVRHGKWIKGRKEKLYYNDDMSGFYDFPVTCSVCKFDITDEGFYETDYCPKCGAKMDGVENNQKHG